MQQDTLTTPILISLTSSGEPDGVMRMQVAGKIVWQKTGWVIHYTEAMEDPDSHEIVSADIKLLVREGYVMMMRSG